MQKLAKKLSFVMVALLTVSTLLNYVPSTKAKAATVVPTVQFVGEQKLEYNVGERITFNLNAANYGGRVQYRVVLWNDATKSYSDLWNTADRYYANWMPYGNETLPLGWVINEPGSYRITVYAKRAGLANDKTALTGANCDSFVPGPAFVVKPAAPAVDANYETAVKAVAAYEAAPLTTLEQVTAAEALKTAATTAVAAVADATKKAELTAKVAAQDVKVAAAKEATSYVNVVKVTPVSVKKVKVEFDKEIATPSKSNFQITEKDNEFVSLYVDSITVDKNVATLTLFDPMEEDTDYVVNINGVKAASSSVAQKEAYTGEIKFEKVEAAKIEFASKTLVVDGTDSDALAYVIKDAAGNDITDNYALAEDMTDPQDGEVVIELDDDSLFGSDYVAQEAGLVIANIYIAGTDPVVETGNQIITLKDKAAEKLTSIGKFTLATEEPADFDTVKTSIYYNDEAYILYPELLNEAGEAYTTGDATVEYKSYNNSIVLVDKTTGELTPVSTGTATILATATVMNAEETKVVAKASKTFQVEVKADPKATTLNVDTTSLKLTTPVEGYEALTGTVKVALLDQYGKPFFGDGEVAVSVDKYNNKDDESIIDSVDETLALEEDTESDDYATANLEVTPVAVGSLKITVSYGKLSKVVTVSVVAAGDKSGYVAEISSSKLDLYPEAKTGEIKVYAKDSKGNKIYEITDYTLSYDLDETVFTDNGDGTLTAAEVGKEAVTVKVGSTKVATFTIEVVDTTPVLTTVTQAKDAITVAADATTDELIEAIFGKFDADGILTNTDKVVFVTKDQAGKDYQVVDDDVMIKVVLTDGTVAKCDLTDLQVGTDSGKKAIVTVTMLDKVYVLEVYVK